MRRLLHFCTAAVLAAGLVTAALHQPVQARASGPDTALRLQLIRSSLIARQDHESLVAVPHTRLHINWLAVAVAQVAPRIPAPQSSHPLSTHVDATPVRNSRFSSPPPVVAAPPSSVYGALMCIHSWEGAWNADTGNGFYGGLQFVPGTWNNAVTMAGYPSYANGRADLAPVSIQLAAGAWLFTHSNVHSQWPVSSRRCGL